MCVCVCVCVYGNFMHQLVKMYTSRRRGSYPPICTFQPSPVPVPPLSRCISIFGNNSTLRFTSTVYMYMYVVIINFVGFSSNTSKSPVSMHFSCTISIIQTYQSFILAGGSSQLSQNVSFMLASSACELEVETNCC